MQAAFLSSTLVPREVILGLVPRIQLSPRSGARGWLDGRDNPGHGKAVLTRMTHNAKGEGR
jgi:hypothetical protein